MVFSGSSVSSTNKTDHHDTNEILLKVALNTINLKNFNSANCLIKELTNFTRWVVVGLGTDCIGSHKSNYHTIKTAPRENWRMNMKD
jgi:hypothetical protein